MIDIHHTKAGIDRSLIRIGSRTEEIVEVEPRSKVRLGRKYLIDAHRKLVRIRDYLGRLRIGVDAVGARWIIRQRIACQDLRDLRRWCDLQRIAWKRGRIEAETLFSGGHRQNLRSPQYL